MTQILDCLVSYFGLEEDQQPTYRRYFCYHIVAGPGANAGAGVASVTTLAVHDQSERCTYCQNFHAVETGGPAAAIAAAIQYLDSYHVRDHLRKVQSDIRGLRNDGLADARVAASPYPLTHRLGERVG
jgi:hypothetical protein